MRKQFRAGLISALVLVISLLASAEFFSFLYLRYIVRLNWSPAYVGGAMETRRVGAWLTEQPEWGTWHVQNADSRHESICFSVAMHANSYGAHDRERTREGDASTRIIVLGDSFAEGWGVEEGQRATDILEQRLGLEFLNFGAATLGPLQYQIIYDRLAADFTHGQVLIFFLPDNDFTDNDLDFWKRKVSSGGRYRPYYERSADGYRATYPVRDRARRPARDPGWAEKFFRAIRANSWTLQAAGYARDLFRGRFSYSGYFDYTPAQLDAVLWSFRAIKQRAGDRPVTIAIIPRLNDFARTAKQGESPLIPILRRFGEQTGIAIVDLLAPMRQRAADTARLYIPCDGHWNQEGNQAVAEILIASGRFSPAPPR